MFTLSSSFRISAIIKHHWKRCNQRIELYSSQVQNKPLNNEGPWQAYSQKVDDETLSKDEHQEQVMQQLQDIYQEIVAYERPAMQSTGGGSLFNFFKRKEPQKIIAPRGLYIYGSVGGGKTMLMDLFYESVPVNQ